MFEAVAAVFAGIIKVGVPVYVAALIGTGLILFMPGSIASQIGVLEFRQSFRGYLGGAFVASISLLTAYGISSMSRSISNRLNDRRLIRLTLETLHMLTNDEKKILRRFINEGENTIHTSVSDGVAGGLVAKNIIYRSSNIIEHFQVPYNLQPIVRKLLQADPHLLT